MVKMMLCSTHGETHACFICDHLCQRTAHEWFSNEPTDEEPYPQAWCAECEEKFQIEGEWNDRSEPKIRMLCHYCYQRIKECCDVVYVDYLD